MPDPTEELLDRAGRGDASARQELLACYRQRLRRLVAVHFDRRLAARLDPSDVVQEVLLEAAQKLPDYLNRRPLPFYPWLRRMAWERLVKVHERHLSARRRSVLREQGAGLALPEESADLLAERFVASNGSAGRPCLRRSDRGRPQRRRQPRPGGRIVSARRCVPEQRRRHLSLVHDLQP